METQNINLLNNSSNEESTFATEKKCYVIDNQTVKDKYNRNSSIRFEAESIKSSVCEYSDAFMLVTGDITVTGDNNKNVVFKNCAPFSTCKTEFNEIFTDEANHIYITMLMYNLIENSDNYLNTSGSLQQFKRDEGPAGNAHLTSYNSQSCKYKAALVGKTVGAANITNKSIKNTKTVVPLKYLGNFWISIEIQFKNSKTNHELNWI